MFVAIEAYHDAPVQLAHKANLFRVGLSGRSRVVAHLHIFFGLHWFLGVVDVGALRFLGRIDLAIYGIFVMASHCDMIVASRRKDERIRCEVS